MHSTFIFVTGRGVTHADGVGVEVGFLGGLVGLGVLVGLGGLVGFGVFVGSAQLEFAFIVKASPPSHGFPSGV